MKSFTCLILAVLACGSTAFASTSKCSGGTSTIVQAFIITNNSSYEMIHDGTPSNSSVIKIDEPPQVASGGGEEGGTFTYCCSSSTNTTLKMPYKFSVPAANVDATNLNFQIKGCSVSPSVSSCAPGVKCPAPEPGSTIEFTFNNS